MLHHIQKDFYFNLTPGIFIGFAGSFGPTMGLDGMVEGGGGGGLDGPFIGRGRGAALIGLDARTMANFAGDGVVIAGFGF